MKRPCISAGFTLIELAVVVILIGIVMAIGVPTWQKFRDNNNLKTAAREVMADLSNAKQQAVEENLDVYRLIFNVAGNSYALKRTDEGAPRWTKSLASFGNGIVFDSVNFSGTVVTLNKRGTVSAGNLVLRNVVGSTATITVNITGRTYVAFDMH